LVFDGNWNKHLGSIIDHNQKYNPRFDLFVGGEKVFSTCLVETSIIDAHLKLPACLGDDKRVGQPPWVVDLLDEASVKQLFNIFSNNVLPLYGLLLELLLDRSSNGVDPRHLRWLPGKHVYISSEEGDEREFLFVVQILRDVGHLGNIRPDLNGL
jgi:hypothetical protein